MAHAAQVQFLKQMQEKFSDHIQGANVVEFGSFNVNGSLRGFFRDWKSWLGIDLNIGPCAANLGPPNATCNCVRGRSEIGCENPGPFPCVQIQTSTGSTGLPSASQDVIISSNHLEHDPDMEASIREAHRLLTPHGLFIFSTVTKLVRPHELWTTKHYNAIWAEDLDAILSPHFPDVTRVAWTRDLEDIQGWARK